MEITNALYEDLRNRSIRLSGRDYTAKDFDNEVQECIDRMELEENTENRVICARDLYIVKKIEFEQGG